jgi:hypothetical protein
MWYRKTRWAVSSQESGNYFDLKLQVCICGETDQQRDSPQKVHHIRAGNNRQFKYRNGWNEAQPRQRGGRGKTDRDGEWRDDAPDSRGTLYEQSDPGGTLPLRSLVLDCPREPSESRECLASEQFHADVTGITPMIASFPRWLRISVSLWQQMTKTSRVVSPTTTNSVSRDCRTVILGLCVSLKNWKIHRLDVETPEFTRASDLGVSLTNKSQLNLNTCLSSSNVTDDFNRTKNSFSSQFGLKIVKSHRSSFEIWTSSQFSFIAWTRPTDVPASNLSLTGMLFFSPPFSRSSDSCSNSGQWECRTTDVTGLWLGTEICWLGHMEKEERPVWAEGGSFRTCRFECSIVMRPIGFSVFERWKDEDDD